MSSRTEVAEHYYNDTVKDQVTDALFIILSFRISADHIKPLAECLSCSVHPESNSAESSNDKSVSSTALQILWDWRNKEALHANCRTLVKAFLTSETLPTDITEFVISQLEGQNQVSVTSFNYSKWDEPAEVKKMRLNFAQAYIKVFEGITQKRISEWLNVANDTNIHEFILRRCNWLNYDLLEELDNDLGDKKVFGIYVKQYKSIMKKIQVFRIPPNSIPTVPVSSRCIFTIFFQPSMQNYSGSVLHEIKSGLSQKFNTKVLDFLISAIDETNLCIDVSIQKRMLHKVTNKKWEDQNLISYDSLVNATSYSLTAECADGLDNYCSSPIDQADDESWVDFVPDIDATQLTLSTFDDTKFSAAVEDVDIVGDLVVNLNIGPKLKISMEEFKRIILNQKVPVALCLVAVMGLPDCNKTSILESILRENIKLKETATRNFEEYMTRKKNPDGLSIYELCVLGGKPYDQYSWSFATEQYGAIFSILCGLVRHIALAKSDIKRVEFLSDGHVSQNKLVDHHFKLLMGKAAKQLKDISMDEKKEALFLNGLTLANIMDVGVNKALYDFLPIMLSFCRGHLRLVFFSLERDGPKLDEVPDLSADHYSRRGDNRLALTMRSRLNCILHFATLGHNPKQKEDDSKRTLVVASSNSQSVVAGFSSQLHKAATDKIQEEAEKLNIKKFVSNVALVSINDADSLKKAKEEITKFIMKEQIFQKTLPLKWIFLHSFMVSVQQKEGAMKAIILKKREVYDYAAKELRMDEEDFENFLVTFTDFGSILYMPQFRDLRDIVVVDIWEFVQFLNELIYPKKEKKWYKDLTTYGIIKISDASEILKKHMEIFIKIIITFGMAAFISKEKAFLNGRFLTEVCYYLPSARIDKKSPSGHSNDYAFLKIESPNFPANIQASISHEIMKRQNFYLIGNESFDTSQFGYCTPSGCPIQITMVYGGSQTKLILHINDACTGMHHCVSACKGVIEACCDSLDKISNQIQYLKYSIGIPCSAVDGDSHLFNFKDDSDLCQACIRSIDSTISCHKYWIEAAKMCNKGSKTRMSESTYGLKTKLLEKDAHISKLMKKKSQLLEMITSLKKQLTKETRSVKVQSNYLMRLMDDLECLSDVQVAEKKLFLIQGDKPQLMNWEKYGLRIGVQEGSLLSSETVEAAVVALVGGQFEFPPNTVLVSAVYAVSLSKPLLKRLKLEIQHCIDLTGRPDLAQCLKFAIAPMSTPSLPYLFKLVEGGEFSSKSGYGFIQRNKFCLVCILGEEWTYEGGNGVPSVNGDTEQREEQQQSLQEVNEEEEEEQQLQHEEEEIEHQDEYEELHQKEEEDEEGDDSNDSSSDSSSVSKKNSCASVAVEAAKEFTKETKQIKRNEDKQQYENSSSTKSSLLITDSKSGADMLNQPCNQDEHSTSVKKVSQQHQPEVVNQQIWKQLEQAQEQPVEGGLQGEEKEQAGKQLQDKSEELDQQQQTGGIQEQEGCHQEGVRGQEEKRQDDSLHAKLAKGKEDKELIDENSILDDSGSIASPLVSAVAAFKSMDQTELLDKPASTESHEVHSTGMKEATNYAGLIYYEEKHAEDLVTFIAAKKLDALLQFIEGKHSKAEMGPNVYFRIASPFIELNLNAPQKKSFKGWTIEPHTEPCKLFQRDIFNFGDKDYSLPPSCLISVYSSPDAVPTLHYSVPVEGVADPVTLNIHRSRRTAHLTAVAASGSDEATPAPTKIGREGGIDIKTARQKIKEVMNKNHSNYADILESSLNEIANKLFEAGIITRQVQKSPTYESITSSFLSVMNLLDSKSDLEKHCMKYLEALFSIGGPIEFVANHLREKWTAALEGALQFEHESN